MKKKLAYFGVKYYPSRGGVSRTTELLIRELKDEFDITIYCYSNPLANDYIPGVNVVQFKENPIKGIGVFIYFFKCFLHIMFWGKYDILHVRKIDAAFFLPFFSMKYKNILATSHESPYLRDKWGKIAKVYFKINELIFINSKAKLTVISKPLSKYYKKKYGKDVLFVPNGVSLNLNFDNEKIKYFKKRNKIEEPYVFFAARRIMSTKGVHTFIKAMKAVNYKNDIIIAGDLNQVPLYTQELLKLSNGLKVHFIGYIKQKQFLLGLIKNADYFFFPSETEGMSIMLLEVASLGVPIIASDIPENTEIFNDDELIFFENKNYMDLAQKFIWAQKNRITVEKMANKAKNRVKNEYSDKIMTSIYRKLYNEFFTIEAK